MIEANYISVSHWGMFERNKGNAVSVAGMELTRIPEGALDAFRKEMEEKVIPEIVEVMHQRNIAANKNRHTIIN